VATSGPRARAPRRQTLAVAPRRPAALPHRSFDRPWPTSRAEIVRLQGVPINRAAGETRCPGRGISLGIPAAQPAHLAQLFGRRRTAESDARRGETIT